MFFAVQQTAGAVAFRRLVAVAAIACHQLALAHARREHFVNVFFHRPRLAHPPSGHLPDDGIHPQPFFHFGLFVVARFNHGFLDGVTERGKRLARGLLQGVVQAAPGKTESLAAVNQEDIHGYAPVKLKRAGIMPLRFMLKNSKNGKTLFAGGQQ